MYEKSYFLKVSVILTVYNGEKYIYECMESVIHQTLDEIEIICIDDSSSDNTLNILGKLQNEDDRIKVISNQFNLGAGASRNKGLEIAKGEYIISLDADDIFEKDMLEKAYSKAKRCEADICIFKEDLFCEKIKDNHSYMYLSKMLKNLGEIDFFAPSEIKNVIFNLWNGWAWDKIFRREFINSIGVKFQEIRTTNDAFFVHTSMISAKRIAFINEVLVHHRMKVASSLSNSRDDSWENCYLYLQELRRYMIEHGKYGEFEKSFINWVPDFCYWNYWSLNECNRKKLYHILKDTLIEEFELWRFQKEHFYNSFYYWFIHEIYNSLNYNDCRVPIDATERWICMLEKNSNKIDHVFHHIKENNYHAAVWGVGQRGRKFLSKYGDKVKMVYDKNINLTGKYIDNIHKVEIFSEETCKGIDFIFVTNHTHLSSISQLVKNIDSKIKVFNLDSYIEPYLSYPLSLEECIV